MFSFIFNIFQMELFGPGLMFDLRCDHRKSKPNGLDDPWEQLVDRVWMPEGQLRVSLGSRETTGRVYSAVPHSLICKVSLSSAPWVPFYVNLNINKYHG